MKKRKRKKKLKYKFKVILFVLLVLIASTLVFGDKEEKNVKLPLPVIDNKEKEKKEQIARQKEEDYKACVNKLFSEEDKTEELTNKMQEVTDLIVNNKYKTSVYYEDINTGFTYTYKSDTVYYGCSLIKIVDALYLINKASDGEINLDTETVLYEAKYKMGYSSGMAKRKIGEKVSLRDLITYAISVSDNTAHLMLIDYIGFSKLKAYGESLGAKVILTGGDNFGNQTAEDTNIYLKEAYKIITENEEYGEFLKNIMDNNERNDFNTDTIKIYHKYGSYDNNYHDIGLSLEEKPYTISIFTLHEYTNHQEVVQNIHGKIRELHQYFYDNREENCKKQIYGE